MGVILNRIRKLIKDWDSKKKKLEDILDSTLDVLEQTTKAVEKIEDAFG